LDALHQLGGAQARQLSGCRWVGGRVRVAGGHAGWRTGECACSQAGVHSGAGRKPTPLIVIRGPHLQPRDPSASAARDAVMLHELSVENLLLIERARLQLAPGLNVITGETGAGKTVLAHALEMLLGGRPRGGIVRPGAAEAYVEGTFDLFGALRDRLGERLPADAGEV